MGCFLKRSLAPSTVEPLRRPMRDGDGGDRRGRVASFVVKVRALAVAGGLEAEKRGALLSAALQAARGSIVG